MSTVTLNIEKKKTLVPQLRFQEFDGEWKNYSLKKIIVDLNSGISVNSDDFPIQNDSEVGILKTSCVANGIFRESENKKIVENEVSRAKLNPTKNEIIISRMNTPQLVGESGYIDRDYPSLFIPDRLWQTVVNQELCISRWLSYFLITEKVRDNLKSIATGTSGTMKNISKPNFLSINVSLPALQEQQKIASFLSAVDEKIQQLSRKKELLEQYKKGVMQQLFSGKLRFKDENGKDYADWNYKKITDISKTSIGLVTTMTTSYVEIGIPLIRNSDIKENRINKNKLIYLDVDFATKHKHKKFSLGDIVTVHTGEVGVSAVIDDSLVGSLGFATLNTKVNKKIALPEFVCLYYNTIAYIDYAVSMSTGDGRSNYNLKDFDKAVIPIPSLDEQKKIAEFINAIYDKIESTSQQIKQTKSFKKGLLQQLFV